MSRTQSPPPNLLLTAPQSQAPLLENRGEGTDLPQGLRLREAPPPRGLWGNLRMWLAREAGPALRSFQGPGQRRLLGVS